MIETDTDDLASYTPPEGYLHAIEADIKFCYTCLKVAHHLDIQTYVNCMKKSGWELNPYKSNIKQEFATLVHFYMPYEQLYEQYYGKFTPT